MICLSHKYVTSQTVFVQEMADISACMGAHIGHQTPPLQTKLHIILEHKDKRGFVCYEKYTFVENV